MFSLLSEMLILDLGYCLANASAVATLTGLLPVETWNMEPALTLLTCIVFHDRHHLSELDHTQVFSGKLCPPCIA
jgi:hypothetical protein